MKKDNIKKISNVVLGIQVFVLIVIIAQTFAQKFFVTVFSGINIKEDIFVIPISSLVSVGISLIIYGIFWALLKNDNSYQGKGVGILFAVIHAVFAFLTQFISIIPNMYYGAKGTEYLATYSSLIYACSLFTSPFTICAGALFYINIGLFIAYVMGNGEQISYSQNGYMPYENGNFEKSFESNNYTQN